MAAVNITIDLGDVQDLIDRIAEFRRTVIQFMQIGLDRMVLPKLRAIVPFRTGRLRAARIFVPTAGGGYFGWTPAGFYWRFQPGLGEESQALVRGALPALIRWAVAQARRKLQI